MFSSLQESSFCFEIWTWNGFLCVWENGNGIFALSAFSPGFYCENGNGVLNEPVNWNEIFLTIYYNQKS